MNKKMWIAIMAVAGLLMMGCGVSTNEPHSRTVAVSSAPSTAPLSAEVNHDIVYSNGLSLQVSGLYRYVPSDAATATGMPPHTSAVRFTLKLTNGTNTDFNTALCTVKMRYGKDGKTAERTFDSNANIGMGVEGTVAATQAVSAEYAFWVPDGPLELMVIEVVPGILYKSALFTGALT